MTRPLWHRVGGSAGLVALLAAISASGAAAQDRPARERQTQASIFAGQHIDNSWQDVFDTSDQLEWANAGLAGVAVGYDWRRPGSSFSWGVEFQTVSQFGDQHHIEFNLPLVVRYHMAERVPVLRSLAFALGPSYATKVPEYEVESRGDSQQFLMYWAMEAEFGPRQGANSLYTRLHHRSGMFGTVADEGSSNVIVLGLRHRW